jgi:uncharacterized protein (DUF39 family)
VAAANNLFGSIDFRVQTATRGKEICIGQYDSVVIGTGTASMVASFRVRGTLHLAERKAEWVHALTQRNTGYCPKSQRLQRFPGA